MLQESKVLLHSATPLAPCCPRIRFTSFAFPSGPVGWWVPWAESLSRALCVYWEVEHTCPSMSQYSVGSPKPRLTAHKALSVTHCPSFHL